MNKWLKVALWFFAGAWLLFITVLSSEDGFATALTSGRLTAFLMGLLRIPKAYQAQVESILRTSAHFIGFLILGGLSYTASRLTWGDTRRIGLPVFLACAALAVLDEVKKILIPGRHLNWPEAGLNVLGALCGVLAAMGLSRLVR